MRFIICNLFSLQFQEGGEGPGGGESRLLTSAESTSKQELQNVAQNRSLDDSMLGITSDQENGSILESNLETTEEAVSEMPTTTMSSESIESPSAPILKRSLVSRTNLYKAIERRLNAYVYNDLIDSIF